MAELKTADLEGAALDWAVATVIALDEGPDATRYGPADFREQRLRTCKDGEFVYRWSSSWAQGGPLLVEHDIIFRKYHRPDSPDHGKYYAMVHRDSGQIVHWSRRTSLTGPTPLIAAMRCLVAYRLGDTIDIPEELL